LAQLHWRGDPQSGDCVLVLQTLAGQAGAGVQHSSPLTQVLGETHLLHAILFAVMHVSGIDSHVPVATPAQVGGAQQVPTTPLAGALPPVPTHSPPLGQVTLTLSLPHPLGRFVPHWPAAV
jgi:hypothetical protein